jgi:hypothetical protein
MKNNSRSRAAFITLTFVLSFVNVIGQTSETTVASPAVSSIKATAEIVSTYVWRGSSATANPTPNIQPTFAFVKGNFEIGAWGSTDFAGSYKEFDPYVSLTSGLFKFTLTDYNWNLNRAKYFNFKKDETGHMLEGTVGFAGTKSFPISISLNTMFYGYDKNASDTTNVKQAYSTYIELGYTKGPAAFFFGFTPWASYYNNYGITAFDPTASKKTFSVVNIGATLSRAIKITDSFSLPVRATLVINPSATYSKSDFVHVVFGITL